MTSPVVPLSGDLTALIRDRAICYLATTMPDGSPQLTQTWVDTDGSNIVINTVESHQKTRNIRRDPRVSVTVSAPDAPTSYHEIRGRVVAVETDGGVEHIEELSQRYLGRPYSWYGGRDQVRVIVTIAPEKINSIG